MMEPCERVSHPSMAQVEALMQFLEEKPQLARGFLKNQSANARAHKEWEIIATKLNSIGGGTIKTAKKWIKYWADKKSAVKKKAGAIKNARLRTGGGIEEVPELNEVEERIVALVGGDGFATGDVHLRLQVFDEPTPTIDDSPSILTRYSEQNIATNQPGPSLNVDHISPSTYFPLEAHPDPLEVNVSNRHLELSQQNQPHHQPTTALQTPSPRVLSPVAASNPRAAGDRNNSPPHNNASTVSTPRRRRIRVRRSPPSQRRSQFNSIAEKFIRLEEQRLALECRVVTVLEQNVETERLMAQANLALGEGIKALADAIKRN